MNIVLCGMMGVGKTTVGGALASTLGWRFVDTDSLIIEKYGEISTIFDRFGEEYFREIETGIVKEVVQEDCQVISVGGGLVLKEENVSLLKECKVIYLQASANVLAGRLAGCEDRPLLKVGVGTLQDRIEKIMKERTSIYEGVADFTVDTDGKSVETVATEIKAFLDKNR